MTGSVRRVGGLSSPTAAIDGVDTRVQVDVAVVDSGVDIAHPDLNVVGGVDCSGGKNDTFRDQLGHGTMVAGLVGAIDNTIGIVGVAPGARIWSVRVSTGNSPHISSGALLCAVDWITANAATIEIANLSLGATFFRVRSQGTAASRQASVKVTQSRGYLLVGGSGRDIRRCRGE